MKVIEYFNFKNKPLTKDERQNIEKQVNEFIELYNNHNLNKDPNKRLQLSKIFFTTYGG